MQGAKDRLRTLDELIEQRRTQVARGDQQPGANPPERQNTTQATEPAPQPEDAQNRGEHLHKLIETIQFGDPAEAETLLRDTIAREVAAQAGPQVQVQLQNDRLKTEAARSNKALKDFTDQHPDVANDPRAAAAIERSIYDLQLEDLKGIGVDVTKIPTPGGRQLTPADIAQAHMWYRGEGYRIRTPEQMLDTAFTDFLTWKGTPATPTPPADPAPGAQPRVEVSIDRTARRAAIPQQPARSASPRPAPQPAPQPRDRSSAVQEMVARRNAPRGKVGVA